VPIGNHTSARAGNPTARVRQDSNERVPNGAEQTVCLIFTPSQTRMRRRQDHVECGGFVFGEVQEDDWS
jgi:hypothetical protein